MCNFSTIFSGTIVLSRWTNTWKCSVILTALLRRHWHHKSLEELERNTWKSMVCCCRLDFHHCLEHRIIFFSSLVSCDWVKGGNLLSIGTGEFSWYELTQNTLNGKLFCFILDSANCPHDPGYKIFRSRLRWCVQWVGFILYLTSFIILRDFIMTCNSFVCLYYLQCFFTKCFISKKVLNKSRFTMKLLIWTPFSQS